MKKEIAVDFNNGNPLKNIIAFAIPVFISSIVSLVYSLTASLVVARYIGTNAYSGIGSVSSIVALVSGFAVGCSTGFGIVVSQYIGARNNSEIKNSVGTSIVLSVAISIILTILGVVFANPLLDVMKTPEAFRPFAYEYVMTVYVGIIFSVFNNLFICFLRSAGDSKTTLYILIGSCVLNLGLNYLFIGKLGMGVLSSGIAAIICSAVSTVAAAVLLWRKYPIFRINKENFKQTASRIRKHLAVALPMALHGSIISIALIIQQAAVNSLSEASSTAYVTASRVMSFYYMGISALSATIAMCCGQNFGAGNLKTAMRSIRVSILLGLVFCVVSILIGLPTVRFSTLFMLPEATEEIISLCFDFTLVHLLFMPFMLILNVLKSALQGLNKNGLMLFNCFVEVGMQCFAVFVLAKIFGFWGISMTDPCSWLGSTVFVSICYFIIIKKYKKQFNDGTFGIISIR